MPNSTPATRIDDLDAERRAFLLEKAVSTTAILVILGGLALLPNSTSRLATATSVVMGILLLVVRAFTRRIPPWIQMTLIAVAVISVLLLNLLVTQDLGPSAFFVGCLVLALLISVPQRTLPLVLLGAVVLLAVMWWGSSVEGTDPTVGGSVTWLDVMLLTAIVIAATIVYMSLLLRTADGVAVDRAAERQRLEAMAEEVTRENELLEAAVVDRTAHLASAVHQRDLLTAELREAGTVDSGSSLPNLRRWEAQLPVLLAYAREHDLSVAVVLIDLDNFSEINNRLGHPVGDQVIRRVADCLRRSVDHGSLLSRVGGEEFGLALLGARSRDAQQRCQLLQALVAAEPWHEIDDQLAPTFSAGITEVGPDAVGDPASVAREAVHRSDRAMQQAKREGRDRVILADPL